MAQVTTLIERQSKKALVRARREHNLAKSKPPVTRERFWQAMVSMRLTTRQKSGPESFVARLIREKLFPLGYKAVLGARHPEVFIAKVLRAAGGIRFTDKIASELSQNFSLLETSEWAPTLEQCNRLSMSRSIFSASARNSRAMFCSRWGSRAMRFPSTAA